MTTTIPAPGKRVMYGGQLVLTRGISDWIATGLRPYDTEPSNLVLEWRRHCIAVIVTSHLNGDQLDTCAEDHELNQHTFANPGEGGRIVNVWDRNDTGKIFCITDAYGSPEAVTTVMWADEY